MSAKHVGKGIFPLWWRAFNGIVLLAMIVVLLGWFGFINLPAATYDFAFWSFVPFWGASWFIERWFTANATDKKACEIVNG